MTVDKKFTLQKFEIGEFYIKKIFTQQWYVVVNIVHYSLTVNIAGYMKTNDAILS